MDLPKNIARVAVDVPLPQLFDYTSDSELSRDDIGARVIVPFGQAGAAGRARQVVGVIVDVASSSEVPQEKLKPLTSILRDASVLPGDWLELARFCAG